MHMFVVIAASPYSITHLPTIFLPWAEQVAVLKEMPLNYRVAQTAFGAFSVMFRMNVNSKMLKEKEQLVRTFLHLNY